MLQKNKKLLTMSGHLYKYTRVMIKRIKSEE